MKRLEKASAPLSCKQTIRRLVLVAAVAGLGLPMTGCDLFKNQLKMDRSTNMEMQDFRDALAPRIPEPTDKTANDQSGIPGLKSYVAEPSDRQQAMPLVSISVNQTVPLRDALFELAKQAGYDIELDPRITGSVIYTAKDKPFDSVVDRISEMAGLRYSFDGNSLRVELDTAYNKTYKVDYLSYIRKNAGSISNNISVVTGDGADTGSTFEATTSSESDFWGELTTNLQQILGVAEGRGNLRTASDPQITAADPNPAPVATAAPVDAEGGAAAPADAPAPQAPAAVLQVSSLPPVDTASSGGNAGAGATPASSSFSVNRQAGIVSVYATGRQHKEIESYLKEVRRAVTAQVLIEAKVLEVSLSDEYAAGIDWNTALASSEGIVAFDLVGASLNKPLDPLPSPDASLKISYLGNDFATGIEAVSRFGTVHALASPRLTVLNNQSAVLNVANNQVYFKLDIDVTEATQDTPRSVDINSEINNVPEGVLINVQPSVNLDDRTVSLSVRPTITRITSYVDDPAVQYVAAFSNIEGIQSRVPVVNVQELDSVVKVNSGQAIVMGGLMQDRSETTRTAVPVLGEMPLFGPLFSSSGDKISKTELVIFIKATIIEDSNGASDIDRDLYKQFSGDRRPIKF